MLNARDAKCADKFAAIFCEVSKVVESGFLSDEIGDIQGEVVARPDEGIYRFNTDVVRVYVVRRLPS